MNDQQEEKQYTIYCDLDGVLADFHHGMQKAVRDVHDPHFVYDHEKFDTDRDHRNLMWKCVANYQKKFGYVLWRDLPLMPDARELWDYIKKYKPQILTATGQAHYNAAEQKRAWVTEHFGSNIRVNHVPMAADKQKFAGPNCILIDDKNKALQPFIAAGGIGVLHVNAATSIKQLKELGL